MCGVELEFNSTSVQTDMPMYIDIQRRLYDMLIIGAARLNIMQSLQFILIEI
jgi:hypothetical protein